MSGEPWPPGVSPFQAPTTEQLRSLSDDDLRSMMDWLAVQHPAVTFEFWHGELNQRVARRLTDDLVQATRTMSEAAEADSRASVTLVRIAEEGAKQAAETLDLNRQITAMTKRIEALTILAVAAGLFSVIIALYNVIHA